MYRISPVLWNVRSACEAAVTVYAIDRPAPNLPTSCSVRPREDPAYNWDAPTVNRLLPSNNPQDAQGYVTWATLPSWLAFAQSQGYQIVGDLGKLKPYGDIWISTVTVAP